MAPSVVMNRTRSDKVKIWGALQLYTLRSDENWGIGDFADLKQMVTELAYGADFIGLNLLHALYPASPDSASPYSPSSRRWLNIIYIAVHKLPDFQLSSAAQLWWQTPQIQQQLQALRDNDQVDYPQVTALKLTGLKLAYHYFATLPDDTPRVTEFEQFRKQQGESLQQQSHLRCIACAPETARCQCLGLAGMAGGISAMAKPGAGTVP